MPDRGHRAGHLLIFKYEYKITPNLGMLVNARYWVRLITTSNPKGKIHKANENGLYSLKVSNKRPLQFVNVQKLLCALPR